jgi:hypothetical protein
MSTLQNVRVPVRNVVHLHQPRVRPVLIRVLPGAAGHWLVASRDGRLGGTFKTREAALHYARDEAIALPRAIVVIFGHTGLATSEVYEGYSRVRVSAILPARAAAA